MRYRDYISPRYLYYTEGGSYPSVFKDLFAGVRYLTSYDYPILTEEDVILLYGKENLKTSESQEVNGILTRESSNTIERWEDITKRHSGVIVGIGSAAYFLAQKNGATIYRYASNHVGQHLIWVPLLNKTVKILSTHDSLIDLLDLDENTYELLGYTSVARNIVRKNGGVILGMSIEPEIVWFPQTRYLCVDFPLFWYPNNDAQRIQTQTVASLLSKILGILNELRQTK